MRWVNDLHFPSIRGLRFRLSPLYTVLNEHVFCYDSVDIELDTGAVPGGLRIECNDLARVNGYDRDSFIWICDSVPKPEQYWWDHGIVSDNGTLFILRKAVISIGQSLWLCSRSWRHYCVTQMLSMQPNLLQGCQKWCWNLADLTVMLILAIASGQLSGCAVTLIDQWREQCLERLITQPR